MDNQPLPAPTASEQRQATFAQGLYDGLPIVISYLPVAFAFGLNAVKLGFSPLEAIFISAIIYAGASQFVITTLLSAGLSLWVAALTVMAMDVRHLLYGPALRHRIPVGLTRRKTAVWAFGLTDEVFSTAIARLIADNRQWSENWMIGVAAVSWLSWVIGTIVGAVSGNGLLDDYPAVEAALSFMLPALFLSLLLAAFQRQQIPVLAASLLGALGGLILVSIPMAIISGIGCGCLAAALGSGQRHKE